MKDFIKFTFASCLGILIALFAFFLIGGAIIGAIASGMEKSVDLKPNSILKLKLDDYIPEKSNNVPINTYDLKKDKILGLNDIVKTIDHARTDQNIKGIMLEISQIQMGFATASAIREAIEAFREEGKFVVAHSNWYSEGGYYMASVADEVFVHPLGSVDFNGITAQIPFFKEMFDRLGIDMQVYYAGQFKSATEPFRRQDMSEENKMQTRVYLEGIYKVFLQDIARSRGMEWTELDRISSGFLIRESADAVSYDLVDGTAYEDEIYSILLGRLGLEPDEEIPFIELPEYHKTVSISKNWGAKDKIAVVYAEGPIVDGKGEPGNVGGTKYMELLRKLRKDDDIKAIVLRVNSPGGSVLASDVILRELRLAKESGKELVVSMSDYAASGGYYISCLADSIFARPNTLTGSIGVYVGPIPSLEDFLDEKAGINFDTVKTGKHSLGISPFFDIEETEANWLQERADDTYEDFMALVAEGRNMTRDEVHEIAQGRVWTGMDAYDKGLVDAIGDLEDAIASAANLADLDEYRLVEYPRLKDPLQQLLEDIMGDQLQTRQAVIREELGSFYPAYRQLRMMEQMEGLQARIPFELYLR